MFQRLKGAIDSRIAEEQARQRQAQLAAQGRQTPRRRPQNANAAARPPAGGSTEPSSLDKGPDPKDFEPEFVVGDADSKASSIKDGGISESKRDSQSSEKEGGHVSKEDERTTKQGDATDSAATPPTEPSSNAADADKPVELPTDVKVKLRKLERLEGKYGELLKAYRAAHARVQSIEPFEASLRENTPLTSIGDPTALVEYLNQTKLKGDMVLEELKRVSTERDDFKKKSEAAESDTAKLKAEIQDLKQKVERSSDATSSQATEAVQSPRSSTTKSPNLNANEDGIAEPKNRLSSFSLFSPKIGAKKEEKDTSEDLFSYDSEVPKLEAELEEKTVQVEKLNGQVENLRKDLKVARESTEGMMQTLEERTKEVNSLRDYNGNLEAEKVDFEKRITELDESLGSTKSHANDLQQKLDALMAETNTASRGEDELKKAQDAWSTKEHEMQSQLDSLQTSTKELTQKLSGKDKTVADLEASIASAKEKEDKDSKRDESSEKKIKVMNGIMDDIRTQLTSAQTTITELKQEIEDQKAKFDKQPSSRIFNLIGKQSEVEAQDINTRDDAVRYLSQQFGLNSTQPEASQKQSEPAPAVTAPEPNATGNKKKNKKKKKGGASAQPDAGAVAERPVKVSEDLSEIQDEASKPSNSSGGAVSKLEEEVAKLKTELNEKLSSIDRLSQQIKDQEALKEEIETLRDDLLHQGEEHVEARDALKKAHQERTDLQATVDRLEKELEGAREKIAASSTSDSAHKELVGQFDDLKSKFAVMEKDLKAAEQLAAARFKDIADLKELLSKAQPELRNLRTEIAELKTAKDDLKNKQGEISRLESKHEDLKSEMKGLSRKLGDKDNDIKTLQQKVEQESRARAKVEDELTTVQSDLRVAENKRKEANERAEQTSKDYSKAKEDASALKAKLRDLEDQVSTHARTIASLKEEVSLKSALHSSSQSLVQSLRDQTHELSTQAREALARTENLEEELSEAQRMLSERTREGQTMRTLLNQNESGTESRVREMKERMEAALEERDRVEDDANVSSRRMMREVEDAKNKARDAQRQLKIIENEREELEIKGRSWRRSRDELEQAIESAKIEVDDVRTAMKGLREALDESERQIREAETHKQDLRKQSEDANERIEKLTKANKSLSEEIKALQSGAARKANTNLRAPPGGVDSGLQSSRTSMDSGGARSPAPPINRNNSRNGTPLGSSAAPGATPGTNVGLSQASVDYVYLKNVLLQFLERKDKAHQRQLIPVLGMLLHFDRDEEQKFISAISAK